MAQLETLEAKVNQKLRINRVKRVNFSNRHVFNGTEFYSFIRSMVGLERYSIRSAAIILLSLGKVLFRRVRIKRYGVVLTVASRHDGRNRSRCFAVIGGFAIAPQLFKPVQPVIYMQMHEPNCVSFGGPSLASFGPGETVRACASH